MRLKVGCMGHFAMSTLVLKTAMSPIREYRQVANSPIRQFADYIRTANSPKRKHKYRLCRKYVPRYSLDVWSR
jgi:hypothetical protein